MNTHGWRDFSKAYTIVLLRIVSLFSRYTFADKKTNTTYTVDAQDKMSTLLDCPIFHVIKKTANYHLFLDLEKFTKFLFDLKYT
jgi:hypothetical protein